MKIVCALIAIFVTVPIWYFLLFSILKALGDGVDRLVWFMFWVYLPASVVSHILLTVVTTKEKS